MTAHKQEKQIKDKLKNKLASYTGTNNKSDPLELCNLFNSKTTKDQNYAENGNDIYQDSCKNTSFELKMGPVDFFRSLKTMNDIKSSHPKKKLSPDSDCRHNKKLSSLLRSKKFELDLNKYSGGSSLIQGIEKIKVKQSSNLV